LVVIMAIDLRVSPLTNNNNNGDDNE
jgi:hypothetical protein